MNQYDVQVGDHIFTVEAADEASAQSAAQGEWMQRFGGGAKTGPAWKADNGLVGSGIAASQGVNVGLADVLGAPVDFVNWGLKKTVGVGSEEPFAGSANLKRGLDTIVGGIKSATGLGNEDIRATYKNLEEVPKEYRPAARAGEVIGSSLPISAAPLVAARVQGVNALTRPVAAATAESSAPAGVFQGIVEGAAKAPARSNIAYDFLRPGGYIAGERAVTGGSALGAAGAEVLFPGSEMAQMLGQMAGAFSPFSVVARNVGNGAAVVKDRFGALLPESLGGGQAAREDAAARFLRKDVLEANNELPADVINRLKYGDPASEEAITALRQEAGDKALPLPKERVAERAASPALTGLEDEFARRSQEFAASRLKDQNQFRSDLSGYIEQAARPGNAADIVPPAQALKGEFEDALSRTKAAVEAERGQALDTLDNRLTRNQDRVGRAAESERGKAANVLEETKARAASAVEEARIRTAEAARRVVNDPRGADEISREARSILDAAHADARGVERSLWGSISRGVKLPAVNLLKAEKAIRGRMAPGTSLPAEAEGPLNYFKELAKKGKNPKAGELLNTRSDFLDMARSADAQGDFKAAAVYGKLADGILKDIGRLPGSKEARTFSRELNDVFSRTYAGDAMATKGTGADRIDPALTLDRAFGGGGTGAGVRFDQLQGAAKPVAGKTPDRSPQMTATQEEFIRSRLARITDPMTGEIREGPMRAFIDQNRALLDRFPAVRDDLAGFAQAVNARRATEAAAKAEASAAERALTARNREIGTRERDLGKVATDQYKAGVKNVEAKATKDIKQAEASFADALESSGVKVVLEGGEKVSDAVMKKVLDGKNPARDFRAIVALAKRGGEDAIAGLRAVTIDWALNRGTGRVGVVNEADLNRRVENIEFGKLRAELTRPLADGQPSVLDIMKAEGVLTDADVNRLQALLKRGETFERNIQTSVDVHSTAPKVPDIAARASRVVGAKTTSFLHRMLGLGNSAGEGLQVAGQGANLAERLFNKVPAGKISEIVKAAMLDRDLMVRLLERGGTEAQKLERVKFIYGALVQNGIVAPSGEDDRERIGPALREKFNAR